MTQIKFNKDDSNIILTVGELNNTHKEYSYMDLISICKPHSIEWKNQSIGSLVQELRDEFFQTKVKRVKFTKKQREDMWLNGEKLCQMCQEEVEGEGYTY